jgi:hypothetical protein
MKGETSIKEVVFGVTLLLSIKCQNQRVTLVTAGYFDVRILRLALLLPKIDIFASLHGTRRHLVDGQDVMGGRLERF